MSNIQKLPAMLTETLMVKWSNLLKPDVAFGEASANHNVTVVVTPSLKLLLDSLLKSSGAKKINGMKEVSSTDGVEITLKVKSKVKLDMIKYPCFDSASNDTDSVPFGGDTVRLKLQPCVLSRDNSLSLYLNGIQIITKNTSTTSQGFPVTEGFTQKASNPLVATVSDSDLPF